MQRYQRAVSSAHMQMVHRDQLAQAKHDVFAADLAGQAAQAGIDIGNLNLR
jgi:hypothetical protein